MAKRLLDVLAAAGGLLLLAPLFLATALAIRFDSPGPVFFRQERIGRHGRPFHIRKFRTMAVTTSATDPQVTAAGDNRITRVGRWLRRYKLDELPQLFDVLLGHMSLVGPRPEVPRYVDLSDPHWQEVLTLRPGITGPTQLTFRNEAAMFPPGVDVDAFYRHTLLPAKLANDLAYVSSRSLPGDIVLVLRSLLGR